MALTLRTVLAATGLLLAASTSLQAQTGRITGRVVDESTGAPLSSVQLYVENSGANAISNASGAFTLEGVPAGTRTLVADRLGYQGGRQTVEVSAGGTATVTLSLSPAALAIQGIVATGVVDPIEGVRAPVAVARVTREMMPVVTAGSAVQNLQGRVPGVTINRSSGQPGSGVSMMLRTPTTLREGGGPLVVVDGVILGGGVESTVDIESLDIESIEVIRGAAASSLYGSRAAAGVISIKTARGTGIPLGETRFTVRTEMGISQNLRNLDLNRSHAYLMDPTNSYYVNAQGEQVSRAQRVLPPLTNAFQDKPYPTQLYDNIGAITRPGNFMNHSVGMMGNTETTNFALTATRNIEEGALVGNRGFSRDAFRVNLDHRFLESLQVSTSVYLARDFRDNIESSTTNSPGAGQGNPFNEVLRGPLDVDFTARDENGNYLQQPDPNVAYQNPLWTQSTRENDAWGSRTLASGSVSWSPMSWVTASASAGFDRQDNETRAYLPKGTPLNVGSSGETDGWLYFENGARETFNGEAQLTLRRDFGPLNIRTTFRGVMERDKSKSGTRSGQNFILVDVPQFSNIRLEDQRASSSEQEIRATGYLWDTAFDYDGKYIFTLLGRRDGSSLFGPDNRWHSYYRVAGAWRIAEEPWFNIRNINELKLSAARGTAGGRPGFSAQYEVWQLSGGIPAQNTLGNRSLAPEHTTENEVSLNMVAFDRFGLVLTHAWQETRDQLSQATLPNFAGYSTQWINAGTVAGHTTEFELEAQLIQKPNFGWTSVIVADYSNSVIKDWPIACTTAGFRYNCQGEPVYGIYSWWLVKDHAGLNKHRGGEAVPYAHLFEVNDEGFLVYVGEGNHYWEGFEKNLWGTTSPMIGGRTYQWGHPFPEQDAAGNNLRQLMGEASASSVGWINNVRIHGFLFHSQFQGTIGGQANNRNHQLMTNTNVATAPVMDQAGKPDELKKPIAYFRSANDGDASYFIEDASYLKLRTLSVTYDLNAAQAQRLGLGRFGIHNMSVSLIGRNIFTITNYAGFDPEQALNLGSRLNSDGGGYPPTRSLTAEITMTF